MGRGREELNCGDKIHIILGEYNPIYIKIITRVSYLFNNLSMSTSFVTSFPFSNSAPVSSETTSMIRRPPQQSGDFSVLESMLLDQSATPICLPMDFLTAITSDFSKERELGRCSFGVVYKVCLHMHVS
jgi:hypothetical protein